MDLIDILSLAGAGWLALLSYIWIRHIQDDDKRMATMFEQLDKQDERIDRTVNKIDDTLQNMRDYQTDFNLQTARTMSQIQTEIESVRAHRQ